MKRTNTIKIALSLGAVMLLKNVINAQTYPMLNGGFDANPSYSNWAGADGTGNGGAWMGAGSCGAPSTPNYFAIGSSSEQTGTNNVDWTEESDYFYIPYSNVSDVSFSYKISINTTEGSTTNIYDKSWIDIGDANGNWANFDYRTNLNGVYGFPGCNPFGGIGGPIASSYWGTNVRFRIHATSDGSNPTIFRYDDLKVTVNYYCGYSLSTTSFYTPDGSANTYSAASYMYTGQQQAGCAWNATVTSGNSWLTCSSSATGDGAVNITVTENPTTSYRYGTIDVGGQTLYVNQVGSTCGYTLSTPTFNCPNNQANAYINATAVNSFTGCLWTANVTNGSSWLSTTSSGDGNGNISILVSANTSANSRIGNIGINGSPTFTVVQPGLDVGISETKTQSFIISPNPASNKLTIQTVLNNNGKNYCIYNLLGEAVIKGELTNDLTNVNIESIPNGVYFLRIDALNGQTSKFIKQ